jgi:hypothetical protein
MEGRYPWGPPDVVDLLWFRLLLRASARVADVIYELDDIIADSEAARVRAEAVEEAAAARAFHDRIFRILMERDSGLRGGIARALATDLLERSAEPQTASAKGRLLEDLTEAIFASDAGFVIQSKNVNRGDEEVDLIVRDNVAEPFWIGLHSPLLFVECKHWSKRVGAMELRDFEGKLRNHGQLVRIGILVAPGGITRECREAARRMSRDTFTVVLVTEEDLRRFAFASLSTTEWLGDMIARLP